MNRPFSLLGGSTNTQRSSLTRASCSTAWESRDRIPTTIPPRRKYPNGPDSRALATIRDDWGSITSMMVSNTARASSIVVRSSSSPCLRFAVGFQSTFGTRVSSHTRPESSSQRAFMNGGGFTARTGPSGGRVHGSNQGTFSSTDNNRRPSKLHFSMACRLCHALQNALLSRAGAITRASSRGRSGST